MHEKAVNFKDITDFFESLIELGDDFYKLDALRLNKLAAKQGLHLPPWFQGSIRCAEKLKNKTDLAFPLLGKTEHAEMASDPQISSMRFSLIQEYWPQFTYLYFPMCGLGLDLLNALPLAKEHCQIAASDLDKDILKCSAYNFKKLEKKIHFFCHDSITRSPLKNTISNCYAFFDPARRKGSEKLSKHSYIPSLDSCISEAELFDVAQIKLSAKEDIPSLEAYYPEWTWHALAINQDVKEICGTYFKNNSKQRPRGLLHYHSNSQTKTHFEINSQEVVPSIIKSDTEKNYLILWNPVLYNSHLKEHFEQCLNLNLETSDGFTLTQTYFEHPLLQCFEIVEQSALHIKTLKKHLSPYKQASIEPLRSHSEHNAALINKIQPLLKKKTKTTRENLFLLPYSIRKSQSCFILKDLRD